MRPIFVGLSTNVKKRLKMKQERAAQNQQKRAQQNLRKQSRVTKVKIVFLLSLAGSGCNQTGSQTTQPTQPTHAVGLPESELLRGLSVSERSKREANERAAIVKRFDDDIIASISYGGLKGDFQISAARQAKLVRDLLASSKSDVFHCICARTGWTAMGRGYLHAEIVNTNRDTAKIVLSRKSGERGDILFAYDLMPKEKNAFIYSLSYIEGDFVDLNKFVESLEKSSPGDRIIKVYAAIQLPRIQDVENEVMVFCESLNGQRTNAVPIQRVDLGQPK